MKVIKNADLAVFGLAGSGSAEGLASGSDIYQPLSVTESINYMNSMNQAGNERCLCKD